MSEPKERGALRKRKGATPEVTPEPTQVTTETIRVVHVQAPVSHATATKAPLPPPPPPPSERPPTDFDGLRSIGEMDKADVYAMLEAFSTSARAPKLHEGQRVRARVTRIGMSTAFVDVGSKSDAVIDRADLGDGVNVGDMVDLFVVGFKDGEIRLTRTPSGEGAREMLREAKEAGLVVSGKVTGANEHGVQVELGDGVKAFCPIGQLSLTPVEDASAYVGRALSFKILDLRGRDVLVSHKAVLASEAKEAGAVRLAALKEGDVYEGTVTRLADFGAFVKIPGDIEGLVHVSNIRKERTEHAKDALQEGQIVRVRVLSVDAARQRLGLGIKQAEDAPVRSAAAPASRGFNVFAGLLDQVKTKR